MALPPAQRDCGDYLPAIVLTALSESSAADAAADAAAAAVAGALPSCMSCALLNVRAGVHVCACERA